MQRSKKSARRILLVMPDADQAKEGFASSGLQPQTAFSTQEALAAVQRTSFDLLIVEQGFLPADIRDAHTKAHPAGLYPGSRSETTPIITIMPVNSNRKQVIPSSSGFEDVMYRPFRHAELLLRAQALLLRAGFDLPDPASANRNIENYDINDLKDASVTALFSAKSGTGKTTLACNLAVALAKTTSSPVILIDGNLQFGNVHIALDIPPDWSIFDIPLDKLNDDALEQAIYKHPYGIEVLPRPRHPAAAERVSIETLGVIIDLAKKHVSELQPTKASHVIIDLPTAYDGRTLAFLDQADRILLITTPELSSIGHSSIFLSIAEEVGLKSKLGLVINRYNWIGGVKSEQIKEVLKIPTLGQISNDVNVVSQAVNEGHSLMDDFMNSPTTQDIIRLASKIAGTDLQKAKSSS